MPIQREIELELWRKYKTTGDTLALHKLLDSLAPLLQSQLNKFAGIGLPRAALEMEAKRLTILALQTYDPTMAQMNTHIINYLKKLQRYVINYQNVAHIPEPRAIGIGKYHTIFDNLESEKGREPTITELADAMVWSPLDIERLQTEMRSDLSMTVDTSDDGGFYYFQNPLHANQPTAEQLTVIQFVYFDADPLDKKIMEFSMPDLGHSPYPLTKKAIAVKLGLTPQDVRRRQRDLGLKIKKALN